MSPRNDDRTPHERLDQNGLFTSLAEIEALSKDLLKEEPGSARGWQQLADLRLRASERCFRVFRGVACSIAGELDLRALIKEILHSSVEILGAERGVLFLGGVSGEALVPVLAVNIEGDELESIERVSRTILQETQRGEVVLTADARTDPRFANVPSVRLKQIRSVLSVPLLSEGERLGVLHLDAPGTSGAFLPDACKFAEAMASIAVVALRNARLQEELRLTNSRLQGQASSPAILEKLLVGVSPAIQDLRQKAVLAAQLGAPVLILAEPGCRPELFAQAVASARSQPPKRFETFDCAACRTDLVMEALFGRAKERRSRGRAEKPGLVLEAHQGVLFLNEIAALGPRIQTRLVRLLEEGSIHPVASTRVVPADVQLIASGSRDIHAEVRRGRFNKSLYKHLSAFEVRIPPLRERQEDIPLLVHDFAAKHAHLRPGGRRLAFSPEALAHLQGLPLPGNDLELERLVQGISVRTRRAKVGVRDLQKLLPAPGDAPAAAEPPLAPHSQDMMAGFRTMAEIEREVIRRTLLRTRGNKSSAARILGLQRNTLLRRMQKHGL